MAIVVASALTLTVVNPLGVSDVTVLSNVLTVAKLLPLLIFVAVGPIHVSWGNLTMKPLPGYDGFSTTAILLLYAFVAFESIPVPAGEVREPRRQVPFALLMTIGSVTVLYVLIQLVYIGTLPHLGNSARPLADAAGPASKVSPPPPGFPSPWNYPVCSGRSRRVHLAAVKQYRTRIEGRRGGGDSRGSNLLLLQAQPPCRRLSQAALVLDPGTRQTLNFSPT